MVIHYEQYDATADDSSNSSWRLKEVVQEQKIEDIFHQASEPNMALCFHFPFL